RETRGIHLDAHRGLLSAGERDETDAWELRDLLDEAGVGEVLDGRERQRRRRETEREDRRVRGIHLAVDGRVGKIAWQERRGRVDRGLDLLLGDVERQREVELQRDDRAAARARRRHLLQA